MNFYSFWEGDFEKKILLNFDYNCDGKLFKSISSVNLKSQVYRIAGNDSVSSLSIGFGRGSIDDYAVLVILSTNGEKWVYFPLDSDWLEVFDAVLRMMQLEQPGIGYIQCREMMRQVLSGLMSLAVGRKEVFAEDFVSISRLLEPWTKLFSSDIYWSMYYWSVWFFYACVAEEMYERDGMRTIVGGLMKMVAWLEHVYEGWSVRDACDHYKGHMYRDTYGGTGRPSYAVIEKCESYGVCRKI